MTADLYIRNSVRLNADREGVWSAFTDPERTPHFMFGCACVSQWKQGERLDWRSVENNRIVVTGAILRIAPPGLLEYTTFDPSGDRENKPENHLTVTIQLTEFGGQTLLTVQQGNFAGIQNSQERSRDSLAGWDAVLDRIKEVVE
jgi:uncharacterized protein YndB with AHSA1/START domain